MPGVESVMRVHHLGLFLVLSIATGTVAPAKGKQDKPPPSSELRQALNAVATAASDVPAKTEDKDQGDDHANPGAILRVCSKTTPAARRSAICPIGVSPD